jgi:hypothetical protein
VIHSRKLINILVINNGRAKNHTMKKEKIKVTGSRRRRRSKLLDTLRKPAISAFKLPQTARSPGSTPPFTELHNLETALNIMVE